MKRRQLRKWLYASVAVALLLGLIVSQIDNNKLYQTLQQQLKQSGIILTATSLELSPLYTGSLQLHDVRIQAKAFDLDADRLFIDLDLAALLTGKALAQALYLQVANININQEEKEDWLYLLEADTFKLKRIDISQSEIHFEQQHITLEKVDLDIRDIGKNQNPRMEIQAHIGDGRIDAHGYLHMKRGEVTKGFGRVKLYDIPLSSWQHGTTLETLYGSMTVHLNHDASWQSFGHITMREQRKDAIEFRGKITGSKQQFFSIEDMVINSKDIGALQISGACRKENECQVEITSNKIVLSPLGKLLQIEGDTDSHIEDIHVQAELKQGQFSSKGELSWPEIHIRLAGKKKNNVDIHMDASTLKFQGLEHLQSKLWSLEKLELTSSKQHRQEISVEHAKLEKGILELPLSLNQTTYWLPMMQWIAYQTENPKVQGSGSVHGDLNLSWTNHELTAARVELDASQAELKVFGLSKPQNITLKIAGKVLWQENKMPSLAQLAFTLDESIFQLNHKENAWEFSGLDFDFDALQEAGITLPPLWQPWHGYIRGKATLLTPEADFMIQNADVDLIDFGRNKHHFNGKVQVIKQQWHVQNLRWDSEKNHAEIFSRRHNQFDIIAKSLDSQALLLIQALPFPAQGKLKTKSLHLPFGTLKHVSSTYLANKQGLTLRQFKSSFYEGSLSSQEVHVIPKDQGFSLQGTIQVGGIHLNNWLWLHKQFGTHLEATIYATLNLQGDFDMEQKLTAWKGDGDVSVYNGKWLFHDKNIAADKVNITLRKRKEFHASFDIKNSKQRGSGKLAIDENKQVSGLLQWQGQSYQFSKTWPNFKFTEASAETK